ncbi:hypothetical protein F5X68DRAFT_235839 [Plectosphaerella plurivora]|uniref:C2H2-type domain-containing protein n=1 Tax=Plectosphaerella plurivora TaxID=936078 RepID=A0A9P8V475_9PEZI|nr:hypothetical protein F5X68DRAFT_235839 [Plectosphaerella plurivora]
MSRYTALIAVAGPSGQQELAVSFLVPQEDGFVDAETWAAGNKPPPPRARPEDFAWMTSADVTIWLNNRHEHRAEVLQNQEDMDYAHLNDRFDYLKTARHPVVAKPGGFSRWRCRACGMVLGSSASLRVHLGAFLQRPEGCHLKGTGVPLVARSSKNQEANIPETTSSS